MVQGPVNLASTGSDTRRRCSRRPDGVRQGFSTGAIAIAVECQACGVNSDVPGLGSGDVVRVYLWWGVWWTVRREDLNGLADVEGVKKSAIVNGDGIVGAGDSLDFGAEGVLDGILTGGYVDGVHAGMLVWSSLFRVSGVDRDSGRNSPGGDSH